MHTASTSSSRLLPTRWLHLALVAAALSAVTPAAATTPHVVTPAIDVDTTLSGVGKEVATADFNEDGHLDLVFYTLGSPGGITVHEGDGTGNFVLTRMFEFSSGQGLGTGDFNGDGHQDIILKRSQFLGFHVWLGLGDGNFLVPRITTLITEYSGLNVPSDPTYEDFDSDGDDDIAVGALSGNQSGIAILLADGTGGFTAGDHLPTSGAVEGIACADFDGDGILDMATTNAEVAGNFPNRTHHVRISVFQGTGSGHFVRSQTFSRQNAVFFQNDAIVAHDRDGDGDLDLFFSCAYPYEMSDPNGHGTRSQTGSAHGTLEGTPGGFFLDPEVLLDFRTDIVLATADFDEDGLGDVVSATSQSLRIYRGSKTTRTGYERPEGVFLDPGTSACTSHDLTNRLLAIGDFDEDGELDVVTGNNCSTNGKVNLNRTRFLGSRLGAVNTGEAALPPFFEDDMESGEGDWTHQSLSGGRPDDWSIITTSRAGSGTKAWFSAYEWQGGAKDVALESPPQVIPAAGATLEFHHDYVMLVYQGSPEGGCFLEASVDGAPFQDIGSQIVSGGYTGSYNGRSGWINVIHPFQENVEVDLTPFAGSTVVIRFRLRCCGCNFFNAGGWTIDDVRFTERTGARADVLFVNGSAGTPVEREVMVNQGDPFLVTMEAPPSAMGGMAGFALYGWARAPLPGDTVALPFRLGDACRAMPLVNPVPSRSPRKIWNNIGFDQVLGTADLPSTAAPSNVLDLASISVTGEFTLQGLILDANAPRRGISTTNALIVKIE